MQIKEIIFFPLLLFYYCYGYAQHQFTDITEQAGIKHQFQVYEGMFGGGACVLDINKDGYEDFYITSGMREDQLYLNQGDGTFQNIYEGSGLEITRQFVTQGVVGADVNRDGWTDLFITTTTTKDSTQIIPRAENLLFLNNGDNTFTDATKAFRLHQMYAFSTGANFGDFNADGYPDLYVGNYFLEYDGPLNEISDATIVNASKTAHGYLLLNQKGKYFKNVYEAYGLTHRGFGFGGVFTDFDNDGDQDLLVNHDFGYKAKPNYLLRNDYPKKRFSYVEKSLDMDLRINAMGAAVGDYDNNGVLDYFITNIKFNRFMSREDTSAVFKDKAKELGTSIFTISWGANFADFDHDGDQDLFVANGDLNPNCTPMGNFYFENQDGKFQDLGMAKGIKDYGIGRGSVIFDLENDGDMDLLVINQKAVKHYPIETTTRLYRNDSISGNWLKIKLKGIEAESDGIGSRVKVVAGNERMIREIDGGGSSHLSNNSKIVHFGLGDVSQIDSIIITWTGGKQQVILDQAANQLLSVEEIVSEKKTSKAYLILLIPLILLFLFFFQQQKSGQK
ncbi:MAG: CRTAC1 family protein [Bacteroidota bacterium]